jgi:hypothetical protein
VRVLHDPPRQRPGPAIQVEPEDRLSGADRGTVRFSSRRTSQSILPF